MSFYYDCILPCARLFIHTPIAWFGGNLGMEGGTDVCADTYSVWLLLPSKTRKSLYMEAQCSMVSLDHSEIAAACACACKEGAWSWMIPTTPFILCRCGQGNACAQALPRRWVHLVYSLELANIAFGPPPPMPVKDCFCRLALDIS